MRASHEGGIIGSIAAVAYTIFAADWWSEVGNAILIAAIGAATGYIVRYVMTRILPPKKQKE